MRVATTSDELSDLAMDGSWPKEMVISGDMGIGKSGNPVTIFIEDEVTGETLEINNIRSAFLILEDTRKNTNGWMAMAIGGIEKLSSVLNFLSQTTLESLRRLVEKDF